MTKEKFRPSVTPITPETIKDILNRWEEHNESIRHLFEDEEDYEPSQLTLEGIISQEEKQKIFAKSIEAMRTIAQQHGISFPVDLLSRLFIVDKETFISMIWQEENLYTPLQEEQWEEYQEDAAGTTLPNRVCLLNDNVITKLSKNRKSRKESLYRSCGIHELWHSLEYQESWSPVESDQKFETRIHSLRRCGILTKQPKEAPEHFPGLIFLEEGFIEHLTRKTLHCASETMDYFPYRKALEVNDMLVERIGSGAFFQAIFTKNGFRKLAKALELQYGSHSLRKLANIISKEDSAEIFNSMLGLRKSGYRETKKFIRST